MKIKLAWCIIAWNVYYLCSVAIFNVVCVFFLLYGEAQMFLFSQPSNIIIIGRKKTFLVKTSFIVHLLCITVIIVFSLLQICKMDTNAIVCVCTFFQQTKLLPSIKTGQHVMLIQGELDTLQKIFWVCFLPSDFTCETNIYFRKVLTATEKLLLFLLLVICL